MPLLLLSFGNMGPKQPIAFHELDNNVIYYFMRLLAYNEEYFVSCLVIGFYTY